MLPHALPAWLRRALRPAVGVAVLGGVLAAAPASAQDRPAAPDIRARIERLAERLDLTPAQRAELERLAERYAAEGHEPGLFWRLADDIDDVLTPEQRERLQARVAERPERRPGRVRDEARARRRMHNGAPGPMRRSGERRGREMRGVAPEHRDAARAVAERYRAEFESLRGAMRAEMEPLMTPEARARVAEARQARARAEAARDAALRLTPDQREALRARGADARAALTPEQASVVALHRALVEGARMHRRERMHGGRERMHGGRERMHGGRERIHERRERIHDGRERPARRRGERAPRHGH